VEGPCRLCGAAIEDPWHALLECDHNQLRDIRQRFLNDITRIISTLFRMITKAHHHMADTQEGITTYAASRWNTVRTTIAQANTRLQLTGPLGDPWVAFICYKLITGMPISAAMLPALDLEAPSPTQVLATAVGTILDNILMSRRGLRPVADVWSRWSISHINSFAAIYRAVPIVLPALTAAAITEGAQDL
jgi:hypothetical protein